jgi:hypothetical protein
MTRDEYARSVGLRCVGAYPAHEHLADIAFAAGRALEFLESAELRVRRTGYARRSCLAVALAATRGLLAVVRWDLERVSKEE